MFAPKVPLPHTGFRENEEVSLDKIYSLDYFRHKRGSQSKKRTPGINIDGFGWSAAHTMSSHYM